MVNFSGNLLCRPLVCQSNKHSTSTDNYLLIKHMQKKCVLCYIRNKLKLTSMYVTRARMKLQISLSYSDIREPPFSIALFPAWLQLHESNPNDWLSISNSWAKWYYLVKLMMRLFKLGQTTALMIAKRTSSGVTRSEAEITYRRAVLANTNKPAARAVASGTTNNESNSDKRIDTAQSRQRNNVKFDCLSWTSIHNCCSSRS